MEDLNLESHDTEVEESTASPLVLLFTAPLMGAAAGGMGWGIRGQYGHEWGVMVPGVLVAFTLVFLFGRRSTSLHAARAVALTALAFSFGGTMTYGQTVGLTHDTPLVGNHHAYRWGMIGLFIKGGLWIGFGGAFLGIGLGGKKYRWKEILGLYAALIVFSFIGIQLLNRPYVPQVDSPDRALPWIYFSDHWKWEPDKLDMKPRRECWGGLLAALAALVTYVWYIKKDKLARNMAFVGVLAGGLGFTLGQGLQAKHSWTPGWLTGFDLSLHESLPGIFPEKFFSLMGWNWWNMMETTFGAVLGFGLGLGLWFNRKLVARGDRDSSVEIPLKAEWILIVVYAFLVYLWGVKRYKGIDPVANFPLTMGLLPVVCVLGGRYWPYMLSLPLITLPIAGITLKIADKVHLYTAFFIFFILPLGLMTLAALYFEKRGRRGLSGRIFARHGLILSALVYYSLNFAFFGFPWATLPMVGRHTNNWIFLRCTELLIFGALILGRRDSPLEIEERTAAMLAQDS